MNTVARLSLRTIAVTGSRNLGGLGAEAITKTFEAAVETVGAEFSHFFVGASLGVDRAFIRWRRQASDPRLTIVLPGLVDDTGEEFDGCEVVKLGLSGYPSREAFRGRERWMLERCQFVLAFPVDSDKASGTQYVIDTARELRLPTLVVPILPSPFADEAFK